ncbi:MAG: TonB-dependent receptor [Bacteroidales bacterium]|nr:TonB-dependent receptor [Bacteroidales bacterium]
MTVQNVWSQNKTSVSGRLVGKQANEPIEYASVALFSLPAKTLVGGTVTDSAGKFNITGIANGRYELRISYVGYRTLTTDPFDIQSGQTRVDLGCIVLEDESELLGEVTVNGQRSTYQQTVDKKIFNVGSDIASGAGSVSDLLAHVPSVQVDIEGDVSLRGNGGVLVLINGKPSVLTKGANRGTVLQQIPAANIERIEVITNPSAQYKPDGTSGIINLILKKEKRPGLQGSILGNYGNQGRHNAGINLGWNTDHWGITANYGYRKDRRDRTNYNDRTLTDLTTGEQTFVSQHSDSWAPSKSHTMSLGVEWNPTDNDAFEVSGDYTDMRFPRTEENHTLQWHQLPGASSTTTDITYDKDYMRSRIDPEKQKEGEVAIAYTHTFAKDHELTADYTYAWQDELEDNHYTNVYTLPASSTTYDNTRIGQKEYSHLIRLIMTDAVGEEGELVTGLEVQIDSRDMDFYVEDLIDSRWTENLDKSNRFVFDQHLYTAYCTWQQTIERFGWLLGLRAEYVTLKSDLRTLNQVVNDHYFMCYPTLHTSFDINDNQQLQLNYSLRVNRPEGDDLNPFPEYQDPYNLKAGNPHLKPEKIHSIELGWQYKKDVTTLILTPYYRYTFDKLTSITKVLDDGVLMTTKENMSSSSAAGVELVLNSGFGRWCNFNLSSNLYYNTIDASDLGYSDRKGSMAWYVSLNADFHLGRNLMMQLNTRYNSSVLTPQGKKGSTYILNLGARYELPRYNLAFTATVSDLLDSFKSVTYIDTPTIHQVSERRKAPRTVYIGLSYRFGGKGESKKDRQLKYDESL